ncbi:MAG: hypothetical protein V4648_07610 [Bacteroidota bacterium]
MKKQVVLIVIFLLSSQLFSQRFTILSGDLKNVKGISEYHCTFDYKDMQVNGFDSEADFLKEKIEKRQQYNGGKDVKGKAVQFEKDWFEDRANKYEPAYINYFNERLEKENVKAVINPEAKYTMNVKTTWIYPGYELAQVEPAKISAIITIYETANPSNILVAIEFEKSIGIVKDHRKQGDRIAGAYEKLAKNITLQMKRFL